MKKYSKKKYVYGLFALLFLGIVICIYFALFKPFSPSKNIDAPSNEIPIVFALDNNYASGFCVTIATILENANKKDRFVFYVFEKNLDLFLKKQIEKLKHIKPFKIHYIDSDKLLPSYLQHPTYYRYLIGMFYPKHKKILYLDTDLYVFSSLYELYHQNIDDKYIAAIEDMHSELLLVQNNHKTFNAGVMLINLEMWITNKIFEKAISRNLYDKYKYRQKDQSALNHIFEEKILWLPPKYNFHHLCSLTHEMCFQEKNHFSQEEIKDSQQNIIIYHYVLEEKPWNNGPQYNEYSELFFKTLQKYFNGYWISDKSILYELNETDVIKYPSGLKGEIVFDNGGVKKILFDDNSVQYILQQNHHAIKTYKSLSNK